MKIEILKLSETAKLPVRAHRTDQCLDFFADETIVINSGETRLVSLGVKVKLPKGYGMEFRERSGLAVKGVLVGAGIIDEDYRGELKAVVRYLKPNPASPFALTINRGDKIVQGELVKRIDCDIIEVTEAVFDAETERGDGGFGSTGS